MKDKVHEWVEKRLSKLPVSKRKEVEIAIKAGPHYKDWESEEEWNGKPGELPPKDRKISIILKKGKLEKGKRVTPDETVSFFDWEEF